MSTEIQIKNLYKPQKKTLKAILNPNSNHSETFQNKYNQNQDSQNEKVINQDQNKLKQKNIDLDNPQLVSGSKTKAFQVKEKKFIISKNKYYDSERKTSQRKGVIMSNLDQQNTYSKLMYLQNKKKQRQLKWAIEREAHRIKQNEQKKQLQRKLNDSKRESQAMNKILRERKMQELKFKHSINLEKFQMIRTARKQTQQTQKIRIAQIENESWNDMKFKIQNRKRVKEARKKLQFDSRIEYERARSVRLNLSQY